MLKRHLSTTTLSIAGGLAASVARQVIVYKRLPVESIGQYILVTTIIAFIQPVISGNVKFYFVSKVPALSGGSAFGLLKTVMVFELLMGAVGMLALSGLISVGVPFHQWFTALTDVRLLYWAFGISTAASLFGHVHRFLCYRLFVSTANIAELVSAFLYVLFLLIFSHTATGNLTHAVFLSWLLSLLIPLAGLLAFVWTRLRTETPSSVNLKELPSALRFSIPGLASDYGTIVVGYFDRLVVGHYMAASALALYGFIYNLLNMAQVAARNAMDSLFGVYFLFAVKNDKMAVAQEIQEVYLRWSTFAAIVVLSFFCGFGRDFILLISRPELLPSYPYFFILFPIFVLNCVLQIRTVYMNYVSSDRSRILVLNAIVVPASIVIYLVSIYEYHLVGACVASTLTALLTVVVTLRQTHDCPLTFNARKMVLPAVGAAALTVASTKVLGLLLGGSGGLFPVLAGGLFATVIGFVFAEFAGLVSRRDKTRVAEQLNTLLEKA